MSGGAIHIRALIPLAAVCALLALPAGASAAEYTVDRLDGFVTEGGCTAAPEDCSLREAITKANGNPESTIAISVAGTIELTSELPTLLSPMTIDATTAPGWEGTPVVAIDGSEISNDFEATVGIADGAGESVIEGLAIGGFDYGVVLANNLSQLCGNHIGAEMAGETAFPNEFGVEVAAGGSTNSIGFDCPGGVGNLISGNSQYGILDEAENTLIAANLIGTDGSGAGPLPNGMPSTPGAGVLLGQSSTGSTLGPDEGEGGPGNTIAFNEGAGIVVANASIGASIFANSIHSNAGLGIEYGEGESPPIPSLVSAEGLSGSTKVVGTFAGEAGKAYFVDLYANAACDPSGSGEGQTYIGSEEVAVGGGPTGFEATGLDALPAGQSVITATASPADFSTSTSVFAACLGATFPSPAPPAIPPIASGLPAPVNGKEVVAEPVPGAGPIYVREPGKKKFRRLRAGEAIPVGSIVNAKRGKVRLTSVDANGVTQTAVFFGGVFQVAQRKGNGLVLLRLRGWDFRGCRRGKARRSGAAASKRRSKRRRRRGRRLWGSGKGKFRTRGNYGAASVRGTVWLTEDRCNGTLFKVRRGSVKVRDFVKKKTILLRAPRSYFAKRRSR